MKIEIRLTRFEVEALHRLACKVRPDDFSKIMHKPGSDEWALDSAAAAEAIQRIGDALTMGDSIKLTPIRAGK